MQQPFRILMLENSINDAEIVQQALLKAKPCCEFKMVTTKNITWKPWTHFNPTSFFQTIAYPGLMHHRHLKYLISVPCLFHSFW